MKHNKLFSAILIGYGVLIFFSGIRTTLISLPVRSISSAIRNGEIPIKSVIIDSVMPNSPAQQAGLQSEDIIRSINNIPVPDTSTAATLLRENQGKRVDLFIERNAYTTTVSLIPRTHFPTDEGPTGLVLTNLGKKRGTYLALFAYMLTHHVSWEIQQPFIPKGPIGVLMLFEAIDLFYPLIFVIGLIAITISIGLLRKKRWAAYSIFVWTGIYVVQTLFIIVRQHPLPISAYGMLLISAGIEVGISYYFYKHLRLFG